MQLKEADVKLAGLERNDSVIKVLKKHIPIAAVLGGMCIGLLSIVSQLLGTIGSGTGLLLMVNIIYGYFEKYEKENKGRYRARQNIIAN